MHGYWIRLRQEKVRISEAKGMLGVRLVRMHWLRRSVGISVGLFLRKPCSFRIRESRGEYYRELSLIIGLHEGLQRWQMQAIVWHG
jgi:hypothetical protein